MGKPTPDTWTGTIPVPPSANKIWRFVPGSRHPLKSREYRAWLKETIDILHEHVRQGVKFGREPLIVRIVPPFNGRRDLDNYCKATLDGLVQSGMLATDRMKSIQRVEVEAGTARQEGCIISISRIGPARATVGAKA